MQGSQTRAGVYRAEERNRQTYKWTSKGTTKGAQRRRGFIVLREGVTNKNGVYRAEEINRQTYKWTSNCKTKRAQQRGRRVIVLRQGVTNKGGEISRWVKVSQLCAGVIALKKERDKHLNEHLSAQEGGTDKKWEVAQNAPKAMQPLNNTIWKKLNRKWKKIHNNKNKYFKTLLIFKFFKLTD